MFTSDFVLNGQAHGDIGQGLAEVRFEPGLLRPYFDKRGNRVVTVNGKTYDIGGLMSRGIYSPVFNATSLRKENWIDIDRAVTRATRQRLRFWADLMANVSFGGFNGMAKLTHEYEAMSDPGEAVVDMDGITDGRQDSPLFKLRSVPLPITHSDFWFSQRRLAVSRNSGTPLDTTMAEAAGRRVAEMIEQTAIGNLTGISYGTQTGSNYAAHDGTSTQYGLTTFPYRQVRNTLTVPTGSNPDAVMADVIAMREQLYSKGFFGPFMLYTSTGYDAYLDNDYFRSGSTSVQRTLRERIEAIDGIVGIKRLDFLTTNYQMILIQMTPEVVQAINGMDVTTVQWESQGGMRQNFKVMAIQTALFKAPFNGVAGYVHGTSF